jgi:hypothetical protein
LGGVGQIELMHTYPNNMKVLRQAGRNVTSRQAAHQAPRGSFKKAHYDASREESPEPMLVRRDVRETGSPHLLLLRRSAYSEIAKKCSAIAAKLGIQHSETEGSPRARLADRNRIFLLVNNIYPAILGTMIWALISHVPSNVISWIAILLIVCHFTLDLLYLKLNLQYYDAEDDFRYGWLMFFTDVAIVALIRLAFGTISNLAQHRNAFINPISSFVVIYLLYLAWEYLYYRINDTEKRSPASSTTHYWYLAGWFGFCAAAYAVGVSMALPADLLTAAVAGFLIGVTAACAELYWSVFVAINDTRIDKVDRSGPGLPLAPCARRPEERAIGPTRRRFDADFRENAVRLVRETGTPIAQAARNLGINDGTLRNWVNADKRREGEGQPGAGRG